MALHSDHLAESELAGKQWWVGSCSQKDRNRQKSERQDNTLKLCHHDGKLLTEPDLLIS